MSRRQTGGFEGRVLRLSLLSGLPAVAAALALAWTSGHSAKLQWTLTALVLSCWLGLAAMLREQVVRPLQTITNLLASLREGDFSQRGRRADPRDALGGVLAEVNALSETLRAQRLGTVEAGALLDKVVSEIDVAVLAFDEAGRVALVNRAGERLLGLSAAGALGVAAAALGLAPLLEGPAPRRVEALPGARGPFELRRGAFRQGGRAHQLVVLADLGRALREEERQAWQRLVRVLGHEINNSLAPIRSIAGNLHGLLRRTPRPTDCDEDLGRGLAVIERRAEALGRFLAAYARLARLPPPRLTDVAVLPWVRRVVELEERLPVEIVPGPEAAVRGDPDQLDQALINLLQNAVEAAIETGAGVRVSWRLLGGEVEVAVTDGGPGISETANLFVPFFTTKAGGSGIGLVLSRQIAEAHHGALSLERRDDGAAGCVARLRVPRAAAPTVMAGAAARAAP